MKMPFMRGMFILLALVITSGLVAGQGQSNEISVVGSAIVAPVLQALVDASEVEANVNVATTGTGSGLDTFCLGQADMTTANRPISADEDASCVTNTVDYVELLIGHHIVAVITHPDNTLADCLTSDNLNTIFAPSTEGQTTNWAQLNAENADTQLTVNLPNDDTVIYAIFDQLIGGDGLRTDASAFDTEADIIAAVGQDTGALGVVSLEAATAAGADVKILQLDNVDATGCVAPSAESVENRLYVTANSLFVYVNRASLSKPGLLDILNFAVGNEAAAVVTPLGITPPTTDAYATDQAVLQGTEISRPFSEETVDFEIPQGLIGQVNVGGAANGYTYVRTMSDAFIAVYTGVTIDINIEGEPAGFRRLCNGEIDIAIAYDDMSEEQAQNCDANNITTLTFDLGNQATVLVANTASDFLQCLTTDQIVTIWGAASGDTITTWSQVGSEFPEQDLTLFAPNAGNSFTDLMLIEASGTGIPNRVDTELNDDPLYRAAATANVEGALTYMSWPDYQQVLDNNQTNITLVSVDSGNGCVLPSPDTIGDGSYALSRPGKLIVNQAALAKIEVQSFLWYLESDDNYAALEANGFIGVSFSDLADFRSALQEGVTLAQQQAAAQAEVTAEPGAETTDEPEATSEATPETTDEAEPTEAATVEPTIEPTVEPTSEPTVAPTTEATEEATAEVTEESGG
jgi:ABC-type phosphate transport system substrate-binding protein